ncbi:MAG TPA: hypothetical protein VHO29_07185 [Marmoricola sp.]|nr:hypothetical protein [Marmoricola sp.]
MRRRRLLGTAGLGAAAGLAAALVVGASVPANAATTTRSAAGCPAQLRLDDGACSAPIKENSPTAFQRDQRSAKAADVARIYRSLHNAPTSSAGVTPDTTVDPGGGGTDYKLPEVANMTIYKEGQGNSKKSYTCGPSATRNMVAAMYKHRDGAYNDFGEHQFELWEGTTTSGTSRANVAAALNNHFSSFGHWVTTRPADRDEYLSYVISDTQYHQSVIANIDTEELSFFNGKALNHFDFVYGYDTTASTRYLYIGEEWDPIFIYGSSSYGNPYGKHKEVLAHAYNAVIKTSIHGIVA